MRKLKILPVVAMMACLHGNGAAAADPTLPSLEAKSEILHLIRREKLDVVLPGAMRDNDVDMWINVIRSDDPDPMQLHFGPVWGYVIFSDPGAVASMNDSALAIPLAVQAGLGEVGRHSLLITREYGPRLRLDKIFTDMPLEIDEPVRFGVKEFCDICQRCSAACPPRAIPHQAPSRWNPVEKTHAANRQDFPAA